METKVTVTDFDKPIQIGRRIKEILDERGSAFSVPAFASRIGMSKSTLYRCLEGERILKPSELAKVAEGLNLTVERIKREDTKKRFIKFQMQAKHRINLPEALEVGLELLPTAIGCTERFEVLNNLGHVYFHLNKIRSAHNTWLDAVPHAEKLFDDFQESDALYMITSNLILTYTKLSDFAGLRELLDMVEERFKQVPPESGLVQHAHRAIISYSQARAAQSIGDFEVYEQKMYEQLEHFRRAGGDRRVGIALHNVAYMLHNIGNYKKAQEAFKDSINHLQQNEELATSDLMYITKKDYAKTLLELGKKTDAIQIIEGALAELKEHKYHVVECKFLLLHAIHTGEIKSAEAALAIVDAGAELRKIACKLLMDHCVSVGDEAGLMKYYKLGNALDSFPKNQMEDLL